MLSGRTLQAVIPGGSSAKILRADERFKGTHKDGTDFDWGIEDIPLDFDGPMSAGTMSGSGALLLWTIRLIWLKQWQILMLLRT